MAGLIFLALVNGGLIALGRVINGRLGQRVGPIRTAFWSHAVGFGLLCLLMLAFFQGGTAQGAPAIAWAGGVLGVAFVALNSHVLPRLGAARTTCLVVAAQMLASVAMDSLDRADATAALTATCGVALIVAGVWLSASGAGK